MLSYLLTFVDPELRENLIELYTKHNDSFIKHAREFLYSLSDKNYYYDAEDIVQQAYDRVIKYDKLDFTRSEGEIKAYMISVIERRAIDLMNQTNYTESVEEKYDLAGMTEQELFDKINISENYFEVVACIKEMNFEYSCTLLFRLQGWSVNEIAEQMGVSQQTIYSRIHRAQVKLIDKVEGGKDYGRLK